MNIMVTGAAGEYGTYALKYLKEFAANDNIIAQARDERKADNLRKQGYEVRVADYSDFEGMKRILKDIDRLLFVSVSIPGIQKNVVDAAKENGVKYIAYTSIFDPYRSKFGLEINHLQTEEWIKESGIAHTFLRDAWYTELNQGLIKYAYQTKEFPYIADKGVICTALKREYAEAGARVIAGEDYPEIIELCGRPYSYYELGKTIEECLGEHIDMIHTTGDDALSRMIKGGVSEQWAQVSLAYQSYVNEDPIGEREADPSAFEEVLGHPLTSLSEAVKETVSQ